MQKELIITNMLDLHMNLVILFYTYKEVPLVMDKSELMLP